MWTRRHLLKNIAASSLALPFFELGLGLKSSWANEGRARRLIIFYFPDGVPGVSQNGDESAWHARGEGGNFTLPEVLSPLESWRNQCVFLNGLSMGGTDSGSHPGGAKKLLTGVDGGNGESIDQYLARTVGGDRPFRHLYLGTMANHNNASGDQFISYIGPQQTAVPEDHPINAFNRLFSGGSVQNTSSSTSSESSAALLDARLKQSVIDGALEDLRALQTKLGGVEQRKLNQHLEALRELEQRIHRQVNPESTPMMTSNVSCSNPSLNLVGVDPQNLYDAQTFPATLRTQIDLMVMGMSCGLSRIGVLQASHHTSELVMSRFPNTEFSDPSWDMRSHQASHYGATHNWQSREFSSYVRQRQWFVSQFAYLLESLANQPEGGGSMLDHSLVLLCTEVCDGNTHLHDNMPFILAGGGGGRLSGGRVLNTGFTRHSHLLTSLAHAMGDSLPCFGQACTGPLSGLLNG